MANLAPFLRSHVSWTTDLGVEVGMTSFRDRDWVELLPAWLRDGMLEADGIGDDDAHENPGRVGVHDLMSHTLVVPGSLHLMHNAISDLHSRLSYWKTSWERLTAFDRLLNNQRYRERYVAQCLLGTPAEAEAHTFRDFSGKLYEKRWNATILFMCNLAPLIDCLQRTWDEADKQII